MSDETPPRPEFLLRPQPLVPLSELAAQPPPAHPRDERPWTARLLDELERGTA